MHDQMDSVLQSPSPSHTDISPMAPQKESPKTPPTSSQPSDPASSPEFTASPQPSTPKPTANKNNNPSNKSSKSPSETIADPSLTPASAPSSQKKKKKRKNNSASRSVEESDPLLNESTIHGDGLEQWRARATNRRTLLAKAQSDNATMKADLSAALARIADAEHAEATVNKGLLTAKSVIAQRDRAIADLTSAHQQLKGEHAKVTEEKKKLERRLVILKTVSINLQEAREGKDLLEKKLEEFSALNATLTKQIATLEATKIDLQRELDDVKVQVDALNVSKQQLSKVKIELDELRIDKEESKIAAKRSSVRAAGLGAAGAFALSSVIRLIGGRRK